jgi:hypothetical protein
METKWEIFIEDLPSMLPTKFRFIWPSGFREEDLKKSANQKQELPVAAMFVNGSGRNEQSLWRTFHRCFLPSFSSFGWGVSEEKIKMWKVNGRRMPSWWWQKLTWQGELKITEQNLDCVFHLTATIASSNDDNNSFNVFVKLFFFCKFHKLLHNRRQGYGTTNDLSHLRKAC